MKREWMDAAKQIASDPPPLTEWESGGDQGWPFNQNVKKGLVACGWPHRRVIVPVAQREHRGPRAGQQTTTVDQEITVFPLSWLRLLAQRIGVPLREVCKGKVTNL